VKGSYNIVYDGTMSSKQPGMKRIKQAKAAKYELRFIGTFRNMSHAIMKARTRAIATGRWVPISIIIETHRGFARNYYSYIDKMDKFVLYNTIEKKSPIQALSSSFDENCNNCVVQNSYEVAKFMENAYLTDQEILSNVEPKVLADYAYYDSVCKE